MTAFSWRFVTIAAFFVTSLVVSNIIAVKLAEVGGRVFDAGNILFPLAYLLADVLTEVGFAARRVILLGFACNVVAVVSIQLALRLPAADFWAGNQEAYETILGTTWRIFVASLVAYLVGELTNSRALAHEGGDGGDASSGAAPSARRSSGRPSTRPSSSPSPSPGRARRSWTRS